MSHREPGRTEFAILLLLAWGVAAAQLLVLQWNPATGTMTDPDDVMRLVQLRAFLDGRGWFDLHEPRLGPALGYDSHWSRLIDAGLAGLFLFFRMFADAAQAERLMGVVWPLLWLLPAVAAAAMIAWRIGGRAAALVLLLLVALGLPTLAQFRPGRLDHHSVQIALTLAALAAAAWAHDVRAAAACGAVTGLALAVGLEGLPFLVIAGAVPALRFAIDRAGAPALRAYGASLAAATLLGFLATVAPAQWGRTACDALAINWMEPVVAAGVGLALAGAVGANARALVRWAAVATVAAIAAMVFVALEPRCLAGPYAMMAPVLHTIWLSTVLEMQPLWEVARTKPDIAVTIVTFPLAGLLAALVLAHDTDMRRNTGFLVTAAAFAVAVAMTVAAVKTYNYATWIGMPLVAAIVPRLTARLRLEGAAARVFVALLFTPSVLSAVTVKAVEFAGAAPHAGDEARRATRGCFEPEAYERLARLPTGVIAAAVNFGPFVLAHTRHAVIAAPYHRLSDGMLANHDVFARPPEEARGVAEAHAIDYVLVCRGATPSDLSDDERRTGLWARLMAGDPPDWLEALPAADADAFAVYRVRRP